MRIVPTVLLLSLAFLTACESRHGTSLYESPMGDKPWVVVQERQAEVARLSEDEQKMVHGMASLLQRKHDATGYPQPNQTFESALKAQYGEQFNRAVRATAQAAAPGQP